MTSPSLRFRLIGLPLFTLVLSLGLFTHQCVRRNRLAQGLKEAQTEYTRLSRIKAASVSASAMMAESNPHTHSDAEEAEERHKH